MKNQIQSLMFENNASVRVFYKELWDYKTWNELRLFTKDCVIKHLNKS